LVTLPHILAPLLLLPLTLLAGCDPTDESETYPPSYSDEPLQAASSVHEYLFAVHPLHNPTRLFQVYGPLIDYLNTHLSGIHFKLEASRNYAEFDKKLNGGKFEVALPNPYQTITSLEHGYRVFGKMGDDDQFRGIILVRRDSGIEEVGDLKGKAVSYPAPTALAATMMPQYYLHTHGLNVHRDIENRYVGSQESSIMNVQLGLVAAGATWPPPWRAFQEQHPDLAADLVVRWQTQTLPNNGLVVRNDVPEQEVAQIGDLLFHLHESSEGRAILARMPLSRFEPATDVTYAPVRDFMTRFTADIRPPQAP